MQAPTRHWFSVAPMMRYSHEEARWFWRLLCPPALLYTEMRVAESLLHGNSARLLPMVTAADAPVALQLGGGNARELAECAKRGEDANYAEVNLNCGCPSVRVRRRNIGACLMADANGVAEMVAAMKAAVRVPVTVKCRLAIDGMDEEAGLSDFIRTVAAAGCDGFIVHARRALLHGISPAQNRKIPPLNHARVRALKREFPHLRIVANGGIGSVEEAAEWQPDVDGVMLGRAVCRNPYLLAEAAERFYSLPPLPRAQVLSALLARANDLPPARARRLLSAAAGLYRGAANNKQYRRALATANAAHLLQWAA